MTRYHPSSLIVDLDLGEIGKHLHNTGSTPELLAAAREMITAADRLDRARAESLTNWANREAAEEFLGAFRPRTGYYDLARQRLAAALDREEFDIEWSTDDFRYLCQYIVAGDR